MKLAGSDCALPDRRGDRSTGVVDQGRCGVRQGRLGREGVDEVDPGFRGGGGQKRTGRGRDQGGPAHVGQGVAGYPRQGLHPSGQHPQPLGAPLVARLEQQLQPEADAEQRAPIRGGAAQGPLQPAASGAASQDRKPRLRAAPGPRSAPAWGSCTVTTSTPSRAKVRWHGMQVPHAVVDQADAAHGWPPCPTGRSAGCSRAAEAGRSMPLRWTMNW